MICYTRALLAAAIFSSVISSSFLMPGLAGDVLAVGMVLLILLCFTLSQVEIATPKYTIVFLFPIYFLLLLNMIRVPAGESLWSGQFVRVPSVILVNLTCIFAIPALYDFDSVVYAVNRIAALVIIVGVPSVFLGDHQFLWISIDPYTSFDIFPGLNATLPALRSIYPDTNAASKIAMFALFLALYEYRRDKKLATRSLLGIAIGGVYLTHSRGVILAVFCGFVIYLLGIYANREVTVLALGALIFTSFVGFLFFSGVLPAPEAIKSINLSLRGDAWRAAIAAFIDHPLLGMGFGESAHLIAPYFEQEIVLSPQNSYLKIFVTTGVIGGTSYLLFTVTSVLLGAYNESMGKVPIELLSLCTALVIIQIFENFSLFGVNQSSVLASIMFGYLIHMGLDKDHQITDKSVKESHPTDHRLPT